MRIDSSAIGMESERTYYSRAERVSKVTITDRRQALADGTGSLFGNLLQPEEEENQKAQEKDNSEDYVSKTMEEMRAKVDAFRMGNIRNADMEETRKQLTSIKQQCLNFLLDILFPARRGLSSYSGQEESTAYESAGTAATSDSVMSLVGTNVRTFNFSRQYYYEETESVSYTTQGTVKCADGREINFNLNLEMSRSFQEYYEENYDMRVVSMCDPLVINLDGNIAELSDQTFYFDIDGDGEMDEINRLGKGSGFLALDKNGDGVINDGTELFGTESGNGFADLAAYDSDGNGFIDEGDEIYSKLKIWTMDEDGNQQLVSLSEKGIGAICLHNSAADFALTNQDNEVKGMIRSTGFFLYENGMAGTIQHVDMARYNQAG